MHRNPNDFEIFALDANTPNPLNDTLIINEIKSLSLFIQKFKKENYSLFLGADDYSVDLVKEKGALFYDGSVALTANLENRKEFLKEAGLFTDVNLTDRELEVLQALIQVYSAQLIGKNFIFPVEQ